MAGAGTIEDTAGEKQKLGVLRHFVRLQINFYVGFSATAVSYTHLTLPTSDLV